MLASELLGNWSYNQSSSEISITPDVSGKPTLDWLQVKHGSLLAVDLCRLESIWPKVIFWEGVQEEVDRLSVEMGLRGLTVRRQQGEYNSLQSSKRIEFDLGLSVNFSAPTENPQVLIISFSGYYPSGSLGDAHGKVIYRLIGYLVEKSNPDALVIDLRDLEYNWGDSLMLRPPKFMFINSPFAIVCSQQQMRHLDFLGEQDRISDNIQDALKVVDSDLS